MYTYIYIRIYKHTYIYTYIHILYLILGILFPSEIPQFLLDALVCYMAFYLCCQVEKRAGARMVTFFAEVKDPMTDSL